MEADLSVLIPFDPTTARAAGNLAQAASSQASQVVLAGRGSPDVSPASNIEVILTEGGKGNAVRAALDRARGGVALLQDPDPAYSLSSYADFSTPLQRDLADAVFGWRMFSGSFWTGASERVLAGIGRGLGIPVRDPLTGLKAFKTESLKALTLQSEGEEIDAEIVSKSAARLFRFREVPMNLTRPPKRPPWAWLAQARTLLRYATFQNDADNAHEGYNTLLRLDSTSHYNHWLGSKFRPYLGHRVLEIGAGIGTMTREIEAGRERVIALEVDPFYVDRLSKIFRDKPHIQPYLSDVAFADWELLKKERVDSVLLSNVLEHIEDDAGALAKIADLLVPGGALLIYVPALPALYGSMDEAVGHHRRYTRKGLSALLAASGLVVEHMEWMNFLGIPGWLLNGRIFKRRAVPPLQLRLYDLLSPWISKLEELIPPPFGMNLFAVARRPRSSYEKN